MNRCLAKTKSTKLCQNPAGARTPHLGQGRCYRHGGMTPNHIASAERERAEDAVVMMGLPISIDPFNAMMQGLAEVNGQLQYATERVHELQAASINPVTTTIRPQSMGPLGDSTDTTVTEQKVDPDELHFWIVYRDNIRDKLIHYSAIASKANIDDRLARVSEVQGRMVMMAVAGILKALHVPDNENTREIVTTNLLILDAPTPPRQTASSNAMAEHGEVIDVVVPTTSHANPQPSTPVTPHTLPQLTVQAPSHERGHNSAAVAA